MTLIKYCSKLLLLAMLMVITACNSWLDIQPENEQTSDRYWNTKEEVEATTMAGYVRMKEALDKFVYWGEVRGDGVALDVKASSSLLMIKHLIILPTNSVCSWSKLYSAIGNANAVIKYGPGVLDKDPTFSPQLSDAYVAEAIFIRSLCYYYLVRTFRDVPLILEPYADDAHVFQHEKSTEEQVLARIVSDLNLYVSKCKPGYESGFGNEWQNKGRATKWAYYALMADIYLWMADYDNCIKMCDQIMASGQFNLLPTDEWYQLFYPGNSEEGIFELQWLPSLKESNSLYDWFYNSSQFNLSEQSYDLFNQFAISDYRGLGTTYNDMRQIWKFAGNAPYTEGGVTRGTNERNANWIFYRYADIILMKAEALAMTNQLEAAHKLVEVIRKRAGYNTELPAPIDEKVALQMVIDQRQIEFIGEGKRWFDILRVAKRDSYANKEYLIETLLRNVSAKDYAIYYAKLSDVNGYYLPIHQDEIDANGGILTQNPYYENQ